MVHLGLANSCGQLAQREGGQGRKEAITESAETGLMDLVTDAFPERQLGVHDVIVRVRMHQSTSLTEEHEQLKTTRGALLLPIRIARPSGPGGGELSQLKPEEKYFVAIP